MLIIAIAFAYFLSSYITRSIKTISDKIQQTRLTERNEKIILKALGIPPILMDSGNNANIRPNMRLYYLETILPIVRKINF